MKTKTDKSVFIQLLFILLVFSYSYSTGQVDRIKFIEQSFNINNIDNALSHYTDNVVFEIDAFRGSGKQALRQGAEWDSIVNTQLKFSDIKIIDDSVICTCTEENDFNKLLGINNVLYDPVIFVFENGLIRYMKFNKTARSQNTSDAAVGSLIDWASRKRSSRLKELMTDGKLRIDAESAKGWMDIAGEWQKEVRGKKKLISDQWLKLWNDSEISIADKIFTKDFVSHIPQFPEVNDLASYKAEIQRTPTEIRDFHSEADDIFGDGDRIAGRFSAGGTWIGKIGGKKIDPVNYTNTWIIIFRFEGDKIAEEWWQFDNLGVMQQLGIIPSTNEGLPALMRSEPKDFVWSKLSGRTGNPGNSVENKTLVMREYKAWNQKNVNLLKKVLDEVYTPDFVYHDPARPHVTDLESYKKWAVDECLGPFPDLTMTAEDVIAEGNKVAVRWTFTGTHKVLGKSIKQDGISIYQLANGKVAEAWCECDMLGTVQQMMTATDNQE